MSAPAVVPAGWVVVSVHESEPKYKSEGRWLVNTRRGDMIIGYRFKTEAEARTFAATSPATKEPVR